MSDPQLSTIATQQPVNAQFLARDDLQRLLDSLLEDGYDVVGPRLDQQAIVYDRICTVEELPIGWTDEQAPGHYRLRAREDNAVFGFVVGPQSWKKYLFPPLVDLMTSKLTGDGWEMHSSPVGEKKYALLGVRACELSAIAIQDRVFMSKEYTDPIYSQRRQNLFIVAVNCTQAATTCFCTSMNTGPRCTSTFDLALTELESGFLMEIGSNKGELLAKKLPIRKATSDEMVLGERAREQAVQQISRRMNTDAVHEKLLSRLEHPQWDDVASRCLSCANCTLVCPTCFCHSVDDVTDLTSSEVVRQRRWDSCFNFDFSHVSGGPIRDQTRSRYRQWLTHKLATWIDQFGSSGCVGCGRCITWCPVGIDLTQEVAAICDDSKS